jgi:hypothetical protein
MASGWRFRILAQALLLASTVEALDISYCSPDNAGFDSQSGKALSEAQSGRPI